MTIEMIVLAAGNSRRFGSNKLLYEIEGTPMYAHIFQQLVKVQVRINQYRAEGRTHTTSYGDGITVRISVVTQYEEIASAARVLGMKVLYNPHPEQGISSSLRIGLEDSLDADACLFTVSDQPWLTFETIESLVQTFVSSGKGIACVCSNGHLGNPCIFSKNYYRELLALTGDAGGKRVVAAHLDDTDLLEVSDRKELTDIDRRQE